MGLKLLTIIVGMNLGCFLTACIKDRFKFWPDIVSLIFTLIACGALLWG